MRISDWSSDVCSSDLVGILADLPGPKIRVETFADGPVALRADERFDLVASVDAPPGDATQVGVSYLALPQDLSAGDIQLLDDGEIGRAPWWERVWQEV